MEFILGPDSSASAFLEDVPGRLTVRNGVILTAWARRSGVEILYRALGEQMREVDVIVGLTGRSTSAEALALLHDNARQVFVYHTHHRVTYHPKVYLFDDGLDPPRDAALLVGSSNLTGGGLHTNFEANMTSILRPASDENDKALFDAVVRGAAHLRDSATCERIETYERIQELLDERHIATEASLRHARERALPGQDGAGGGHFQLPAPPPLPRVAMPEIGVAFQQQEDEAEREPEEEVDPEPIAAQVAGRFYVRTLTAHDIQRLRNEAVGTIEWNIGIGALDHDPGFWGWPDRYGRREEGDRLEWPSDGVLQSRVTQGFGVPVDVVLWHRTGRPEHAAEHRIRIGPSRILKDAFPDDFTPASLVVVERLPAEEAITFRARLLTAADAEFAYYGERLQPRRPPQRHRFGFGP